MSQDGDLPLSVACHHGHLDIVMYLTKVHHCDPMGNYKFKLVCRDIYFKNKVTNKVLAFKFHLIIVYISLFSSNTLE